MGALRQDQPNTDHPVSIASERDPSPRDLSDVELDRHIREGWDVWCELLDHLLSTGGMLPSRELAGQVVAFFENDYWRAEDARIEALRRQMSALQGRRCRVPDRSRAIG